MAKLNKETAKKVDDAKSDFEVMPEHIAHARLIDVDTTKAGPKGPYWSWEYKLIDGDHVGRRIWNNTTLAESKQFGLKQTFAAFDVPTTTDTDDLCGGIVKLVIGQRVISSGAREGELANNIKRIQKPDPEVVKQHANSPEPESVFG